MNEAAHIAYRFGGFRLDPVRRLLFEHDGRPISLKPRAFDTLLYLVEHRGELVDRRTLLEAVWPRLVVEENNLDQAISTLRRVLGETPDEHRFIVTELARGYRFVAPVETVSADAQRLSEPRDAGPAAHLATVARHAQPSASTDDASVPSSPLAEGQSTRRASPTIGSFPTRHLAPWLGGLAAVVVLAAGLVAVGFRQHDAPRVDAAGDGITVAVLPFIDISERGDQPWIAAGFTEEISKFLTRLPELQVTTRVLGETSEIASALRVTHLLKGSVQQNANQLRVSVQLVRTQDGAYIWANTYDRTLDDLFEVQRDVAEKVAFALDIVLDENRRKRMFMTGTRNVEAFEAYQRGWAIYQAAHNANGSQSLWDANVFFERAMALDPGYTDAAMLHMDVFGHQVVRGPVGDLAIDSPYSQEEALALLLKDVDFVVANASSPTDRLIAEITREVFSPTWYRLPELIETLRADGDFQSVNIDTTGSLTFILRVTGDLDLLSELAEQELANDRLSVEGWIAKARVELLKRNFAAANDVVMQARRTLGDQNALAQLELIAAVMQGRRSEAMRILEARPGPRGHYWMALEGDYETARQLAGALQSEPRWLAASLPCLLTFNEIGATDLTRELVNRIDRLPGGAAVFVSLIAETGDAVPFDFKDTPNFVAHLEQAGIDLGKFKRMPRLSGSPQPSKDR